MGFADDRDATLKLKPVKADKRKVPLKRGLVAPAGISNWEANSTALFLAGIAEGEVADRDGWNLLEACGLVPYESGKGKPRTEDSPVYHLPVRGQ